MNRTTYAEKRSLHPEETDHLIEIIDLTSDPEEPPLKRQKSIPTDSLPNQVDVNLPRVNPTNGLKKPVDSVDHLFIPKPKSRLKLSQYFASSPQSIRNGSLVSFNHDSNSHKSRSKQGQNVPLRHIRDDSGAHSFAYSRSTPSIKANQTTIANLEEEHAAMQKSFEKLQTPETIRFEAKPLGDMRPSSIRSEMILSKLNASNRGMNEHKQTTFRADESERDQNSVESKFKSGASSQPTARPAQLVTKVPTVVIPRPRVTQRETEAVTLDSRRAEMLSKLKKSPHLVKETPELVDEILGQTGFSKFYSTNPDEEKYKKAAPSQVRSSNRNSVPLDFGWSSDRIRPSNSTSSRIRTYPLHPAEQAKRILTDRFKESFNPPLTFSSNYSDRRLNGKFQFVSDYILRSGVKAIDRALPMQARCSCVGACTTACECLTKIRRNPLVGNDKGLMMQVQPYRRLANGITVLTDQFIRDDDRKDLERVEISECNAYCGCDSSCMSRVVQKGRVVPLEVFETRHCGFGVRSSQDIVRGQFIELYLGEVISNSELEAREAARAEGAPSYVYSLDFFTKDCYHVDGENFGSPMRFTNHSCNPNTRTFVVLNAEASKKLNYLAFFAIRDIPAGKELTIDYNPQLATSEEERQQAVEEDVHEDVVLCRCGEANCRGRLWAPGTHKRTRRRLLGNADD